ncbi:uncharacterized protein UV8b_03694 [Ustilaginoidea virens]|uniref:DUF7729 domain-containing protein n=1 Tax=Ustilaginoidea virens TaxID=1159556 RepID=A0A8E5HQ91_USTVR|nr:uncharacterized protein UV8b_03694 [Ustilaginoidea virens]QUC19453.1 hypothetical protein UV8b_03694 [Ustilaginoidea virens]
MVHEPPSWPSVPDASHASSNSPWAMAEHTPRKPTSRKRRLLPAISLPVAVVALAALLSYPVVAARDTLEPKSITPASPDKPTFPSSVADATTVIPTASSMPLTEHALELRNAPHDGRGFGDDVPPTGGGKVVKRSAATSSSNSPPLPSPFDTPVPSAFQLPGRGTSCPTFIYTLLSNPTFKSCYPLSMLMQTSTGFFNAEKQLVSLVRVLDASCAADVTSCSSFLGKAAQNLTADGNCKSEFDQNQTQVIQAYRGLKAYKVLYSATCLQNPITNSYCFANAVTNLSTPSDSYLYFMPYGLALPGASTPTCSWCTQNTMSVYHSAAADRRQPVASKYEDAARQINTICGPNFVNLTLPSPASEALAIVIPSYIVVLANAIFAVVLSTRLL